MTIYDIRTELTPQEVIERAEAFFSSASSPAAAFVQACSDHHLRLHQDTGEMMIAAFPERGGTHVRASASRNSRLLARFIATLAPAHEVAQTVNRHGDRRAIGASVARPALPAAKAAEAA